MHLFVAVAVVDAAEIPAAHDALITLADAGAGHLDLVAGGEHVHGEVLAHFHGGGSGEAQFAHGAVVAHVGLGEVTAHGLGHVLFLGFVERELESVVAVLFFRLDLGHGTGTGLNDRHGDGGAVIGENAGHAQLST